MYRRYAIYFTPDGALAKTGAAWLGWDIARGCAIAHPRIDGLNIGAMTKRPRRYGLHATIKPPLALNDGFTQADLIDRVRDLAKEWSVVQLDGLRVSRLGNFLALTALGQTDALNNLAADVVKTLDPFRAPPSPEELARRRHRKLSSSQEENLMQWGYPHVMDDFRFHISLTGPLKDVAALEPAVAAFFEPVLPSPFRIDHLTVAGEDALGMFHSIVRLPLLG